MIKKGGEKMKEKVKSRTLWEIRRERWAAYKKQQNLQRLQKSAK